MTRATCIDIARAAGLSGECRKGDEIAFRCPRHEDKHPSLDVNPAKDVWTCFPCNASGGPIALVAHIAGCDPSDKDAVKQWLSDHGLGASADAGTQHPTNKQIVATYNYTDADGNLKYQVVRFHPKDFRQRRPDGHGGWIWGRGDVRRIIYNLPEVRKAEHVYIVEGERDVESLRAIGLTATTCPEGAGGWKADYRYHEYFQPHQYITVLPDNDEPGRGHALAVANDLFGKVRSVKIVELPGLPPKGDVSDWLIGRDPEQAAEELSRLTEAAPEWCPSGYVVIHRAVEALAPLPPIEWVVKGFLERASVMMLVGSPGAKKTYAMLNLGVSVACGKPWLSFDTIKGSVLFIDEETGDRRMKRRLSKVLRGAKVKTDIDFSYVTLNAFNLLDEASAAKMEDVIHRCSPSLVIIDALADIMLGGDENSVKDVQPILVRLRRIAEHQNCAIIVIHHTNRDGGYRGSSALKGAIDNLIIVSSKHGESRITFEPDKARDIALKTIYADAIFDDDDDIFRLEPGSERMDVPQLTVAENYVLAYLRAHGPSPISQIAGAADVCKPRTAENAVFTLARRGYVRRTNSDEHGRGVEAIYGLADGPAPAPVVVGGYDIQESTDDDLDW